MTTTHLLPDPPFTPRPRRAGDPEPDLTGFVLIHRALCSGTRAVADACAAIADGAPCPVERHDALCWFAEHVLYEIHAHHRKEDDILWPVIAVSAGDRVDLDPLTDDHRALAVLLSRADAAFAALRTSTCTGVDTGTARALAEVLHEVADELDEHIAAEEATVFPVMREYVSARDFARCEKLFQKGAPFTHVLFILPWVIGTCTAEERRELMSKAPPPVRLALRLAEGRWRRRAALALD